MGLDMYLYAEKYVSGWDHRPDPAYDAITSLLGHKSCEGSPHLDVTLCVYYWRKSNWFHAWFVDNVQKGVDECQKSYVERSDLEQLIKVCDETLASRNPELLSPRSGFFFGSYDTDEWYWEDVQRTRDGLAGVLEEYGDGWYFYYQSSW